MITTIKPLDLNDVHDVRTKQYFNEFAEYVADVEAKDKSFHDLSLKTILEKRKDEEELEGVHERLISKQQKLLLEQAIGYISQQEMKLLSSSPVLHTSIEILSLKAPELYKSMREFYQLQLKVEFLNIKKAQWKANFQNAQQKLAAGIVAALGMNPIAMPDGSTYVFDAKSAEAEELKARLPAASPTQLMDNLQQKVERGEMTAPPVLVEHQRLRAEGKSSQQVRDSMNLSERSVSLMQIKLIPSIKQAFKAAHPDKYKELEEFAKAQLAKGKRRSLSIQDTIRQHVENLLNAQKLIQDIKKADNEYISIDELLQSERMQLVNKYVAMNQHLTEFLRNSPEMRSTLEQIHESMGIVAPEAPVGPRFSVASPYTARLTSG